ncbi:MAG: V-type proton ATPase subunit E [Candidatus Edwardsbacteria bacterium]|jgi:vacuolar-type H+-ATPase subunit E/Vma4|nr:V-type proton ATPase subunit E [Candidatus Edwardsbacteria bacterium]
MTATGHGGGRPQGAAAPIDSELLRVIEAEAAAERERVLDAAREQAAAIAQAARDRVRAAREAGDRLRQEEERAARLKAASAAELSASALLLSAKSAVLDAAFAAAGDRLRTLDGAAYRAALKALLAEAAAGLDGPLVITVRGADVKLAGEAARELKLDATVAADGAADGGVVAAGRDGRMMVCNRFADRIERARPALLSRLSQVLWG